MAINATSTGEIRPNTPTSDLHWVKESTVIKRLRRALAKRNHSLLITREHAPARRRLGRYAVLDGAGEVLQRDADLAALARFLGVLATHERIEPRGFQGWRHYVGKVETVIVDGVEASYARPITRTYASEAAARRAVEHLDAREGLVICSFDASTRREDAHVA